MDILDACLDPNSICLIVQPVRITPWTFANSFHTSIDLVNLHQWGNLKFEMRNLWD